MNMLRTLFGAPSPDAADLRTDSEPVSSKDLTIDVDVAVNRSKTMCYFEGGESEHLYDELNRLSWLIDRHSGQFNRAKLRRKLAATRKEIDSRLAATDSNVELPLRRFANGLGLQPSSIEYDIVVALMGAYLHDSDRKRLDLIDDHIKNRALSVEILSSLLTAIDDSDNVLAAVENLSALGILKFTSAGAQEDSVTYMAIANDVANYLCGSHQLDERLAKYIAMHSNIDSVTKSPHALKMHEIVQHHGVGHGVVFLQLGVYGTGRQRAAQSVASMSGKSLLVVNLARVIAPDEQNPSLQEWQELVESTYLSAACRDAMVLWTNAELLALQTWERPWIELTRAAVKHRGVTFLSSTSTLEVSDEFRQAPFYRIEFNAPSFDERRSIWMRTLAQLREGGQLAFGTDVINNLSRLLAGGFQLTGGQITDAVAEAIRRAVVSNPANPQIKQEHLQDACRIQAGRRLQNLARRIVPQSDLTLHDIVLPPVSRSRLMDLRNRIEHQAEVAQRLRGHGQLNIASGQIALFTGPSGTGKTMAAERVASMTGRDLYKIDLSAIVSKWVGETEKNLSRVFAEAEDSSAIIFFDEADSLFSKRAAVHEARDKWANMETNYLLQRMDDYSGPVILATNFRQNLDDAFLRRIQILVEFPFPSAHARAQILSDLLRSGGMRLVQDTKTTARQNNHEESALIHLIAKRFQLSGASLRNIVVESTFQSVSKQSGSHSGELKVPLRVIVIAIGREYEKLGKSVTQTEFGDRFFDWYQQDVLESSPECESTTLAEPHPQLVGS